jgi:hypothetical protein
MDITNLVFQIQLILLIFSKFTIRCRSVFVRLSSSCPFTAQVQSAIR